MDDKTRLPDMTPRSLRFGGLFMIILAAAVPALAWEFATSVVSLAGLFVAASAWAAIALFGYLLLGRDSAARVFSLLICGCGALWAVVLTTTFWFLVRGEFDVSSPVASRTGACRRATSWRSAAWRPRRPARRTATSPPSVTVIFRAP